jgi:hypothetical protein
LNRKLFADDKATLYKLLNLNQKNAKAKLKASGYNVKEGQSKTRYIIITKA